MPFIVKSLITIYLAQIIYIQLSYLTNPFISIRRYSYYYITISMIEEDVNVEKLTLTANERRFFQHKRCFKTCVKAFDQPNLEDNQKLCIRNCLLKHRDAEKFMIDKIHRAMQTLIKSDMSLMAAYQDESNKKNN